MHRKEDETENKRIHVYDVHLSFATPGRSYPQTIFLFFIACERVVGFDGLVGFLYSFGDIPSCMYECFTNGSFDSSP